MDHMIWVVNKYKIISISAPPNIKPAIPIRVGPSTSIYTSSFVPSSFDESSQSFPSSNISDAECNISFEEQKIEPRIEPKTEPKEKIDEIVEPSIEIGLFQESTKLWSVLTLSGPWIQV